jgi:hypothetical protein
MLAIVAFTEVPEDLTEVIVALTEDSKEKHNIKNAIFVFYENKVNN